MICAFDSLIDLKDCVEKLEKVGNPKDKFVRACKVTQWAYDENGADVEERKFYTLSVSGNGSEGAIALSGLIAAFPTVPSDTIENVWKSHNSWDACFNALGVFVSENQNLRVENSDFFLNNILWPALEVGESNKANEWSVLELDISLASLSLEIEKSAKINEGWEILNPSDVPQTEHNTTQLSYRDAAKRGEEIERELPALVLLQRAPVSWQPKIQVNAASKRRLDKLYVGNAPAKVEECDEDFDGGYFESQTFIKGSVGVTRKMAVTKVRPKAMDQKLKRIAEKAKP